MHHIVPPDQRPVHDATTHDVDPTMNGRSVSRPETSTTADVAIIGGGAAGTSAALVLGRQHRHVTILDAGAPRNARAAAAHMLPGQDGIDPAEIRRRSAAELTELPAVRWHRAPVAAASGELDRFVVTTADGEEVTSRRLILATGVRDQLPDIPGLEERYGDSVLHCPFCHGHESAGLRLGVVGDGMVAAGTALYLRDRFSSDVTWFGDDGDAPATMLAAIDRLAIDRAAAVTDLTGSFGDLTVRTNGTDHHLDAVFCRPTEIADPRLAEGLGCARREDGRVCVDHDGWTTVPGVAAAGDGAALADDPHPLTFVLNGAAAGQRAAVWVEQSLFRADLAG